MVNKCVKFHKNSLNTEVMAKVKVSHHDAADDDYADDDTRVVTIPRLFSSKNRRAKKVLVQGDITQNSFYVHTLKLRFAHLQSMEMKYTKMHMLRPDRPTG